MEVTTQKGLHHRRMVTGRNYHANKCKPKAAVRLGTIVSSHIITNSVVWSEGEKVSLHVKDPEAQEELAEKALKDVVVEIVVEESSLQQNPNLGPNLQARDAQDQMDRVKAQEAVANEVGRKTRFVDSGRTMLVGMEVNANSNTKDRVDVLNHARPRLDQGNLPQVGDHHLQTLPRKVNRPNKRKRKRPRNVLRVPRIRREHLQFFAEFLEWEWLLR